MFVGEQKYGAPGRNPRTLTRKYHTKALLKEGTNFKKPRRAKKSEEGEHRAIHHKGNRQGAWFYARQALPELARSSQNREEEAPRKEKKKGFTEKVKAPEKSAQDSSQCRGGNGALDHTATHIFSAC